MDLTESYLSTFPETALNRYRFLEVRNAAAVLKASNQACHDDVNTVLAEFEVYSSDILTPGGSRSPIPIRLDEAFGRLGWFAVRINTEYRLVGKRKLSPHQRAYTEEYLESTVSNDGFEVDNMKDRVALDVEWNAKDGNLDRDLSAYRALYDVGLIDVAVIVTRDHYGIQALAGQDLHDDDAVRRLGTTTSTNVEKLRGRITRGDGGGCPVLVVGITRATWNGNDTP